MSDHPSTSASTAGDLLALARRGDARSLARLISLVEVGSPDLAAIEAHLRVQPRGGSRVVGMTGPPGAGKSTLCGLVAAGLRDRGLTVGVLAVDPSSPRSGGALLGDRLRLDRRAHDKGTFVRSFSARGHLGGLAAAVPRAVRLLEAAGFDVVIVETVGVGQSEFQIASIADTTVLVVNPGAGDVVQAEKAGILEVADVFVVNKADLDGAAAVVRNMRTARVRRPSGSGEVGPWTPPVLSAIALNEVGVDDVIDAVLAHGSWLVTSGSLADKRADRVSEELSLALRTKLLGLLDAPAFRSEVRRTAGDVLAGRLNFGAAAAALLAVLPAALDT